MICAPTNLIITKCLVGAETRLHNDLSERLLLWKAVVHKLSVIGRNRPFAAINVLLSGGD